MNIARRAAVGPTLLILILPLLALACSKTEKQAVRAPRAVAASPAQRRDFSIDSEYAARILPASQVNITPKVGGRVLEVSARVGDFVKKGQVLLTLESGDFDAQLRQAQAGLLSAKANMTRSNDAGQTGQVLQAQAAYDQAQIARDETQKAWDKTKRLYDGGVVSKQQMDDVDAKLRASLIQLDAARRSLELVRDKAGPQASDVLSGQVDAAQAQTDLAQSQLESAIIRSPLDGHVSYRDAEPGALIGTSSLTFVVIDDSRVLAEAGLSERSVGLVAKGMRLKVTIGALGTGRAERDGTVEHVSPAADPRTLLYMVRIGIPNGDGSIRPGMLAKIRFPIEVHRSALLVPERAAFTENGLDYVMIAIGGKAEKRRLVLGESDGSLVEVREGLEEGALVVTAGQEFLADGDNLIVKE
jgi:multidrug efflux pump subunit AcrA (membrane-fusion protein)